MKIKRRRKSSRYPATRTHGRGRKNRTRGSGNRGGVGMSGTGKRADQKKSLVIKLYGNEYFGKEPRGRGTREKKKIPALSLNAIENGIQTMLKEGRAKEKRGGYEIDLGNCKVVGNETMLKLFIKARAASAGAQEAVKKSGGQIDILGKKDKDIAKT